VPYGGKRGGEQLSVGHLNRGEKNAGRKLKNVLWPTGSI